MKFSFKLIRNLLILVGLIISIVIVINIFSSGYSNNNNNNNNVVKATIYPNSSPITKQTIEITPNPQQKDNWETYRFKDYPLSFSYPGNLTIIENPLNDPYLKIGIYDGNKLIMTFRPEQGGLGFENPDQEVTTVPVMVGGKQVVINNKAIEKFNIYYKPERKTTFITLISYPESYERDYLIMIPSFFDANKDLDMTKLYDQIISTIRFVN